MNLKYINSSRLLRAAVSAFLMAVLPVAATAENNYLKFQLGAVAPKGADAHWLPPDFPTTAPRTNFGIGNLDHVGFGSVAIGHRYDNGLRADLELMVTGQTDATGPCTSASDATPCNDHSDITAAKVSTAALLANVTYDLPSSGKVQPFITAGAGLARNKMSAWTRTANPGNPTPRPVRTFSANAKLNLAWTAGMGVAFDIGKGNQPMYLDLSYRYFNLGKAEGGTVPTDPGNSPVRALNFDLTAQVLSVGLRIPF